jgi:hypothetical protein
MAQTPKQPEDASRLQASPRSEPAEQAHHKVTFTKEVMEGLPGYGEPPPEVRKDKLPDQGW